MTYRLFSLDYITTFEQFATTKYVASDVPASYLNLEYIHNNIHNWAGGFDAYIGHMTEVPVAGFDPIFWMHHWWVSEGPRTVAVNLWISNVDRLFAIWQALNVKNKDNWFERSDEQLQDDGTWSIKEGDTDTPQTPLAPFHKDTSGTYYTSDDIRDWMTLYYSYSELQPWLDKYR